MDRLADLFLPRVVPPRVVSRARWLRAGALVLRAMALRRSRRRLLLLEGHLLDDVGLTREEARREARRAFWDAPGHWRRRDRRPETSFGQDA